MQDAQRPGPSASSLGTSDAERLRRRAALLRDVADARVLRARPAPRRARTARLRALRASTG